MIMVTDVVPELKRWLRVAGLKTAAETMVLRMIIGFVFHSGRMSCLAAASSVRCESRHRAQVGRMLERESFAADAVPDAFRSRLLAPELAGKVLPGTYVMLIDGTLCSQQGRKTENTYSTGNRQRRPGRGRRYGKQKHARKTCHSFTMALLITPDGRRVPFFRPYYTREYCEQHGLPHRTTAEAAADLIRQLPLPPEAKVVVLGDTAYDAESVRAACAERGYSWIFPCNPERVLAGPKGKRPKVRSLLTNWTKWSRKTLRLAPGQGKYAVYRRLSPHRIGPKAKPRTYDVHQEIRDVRSVGRVQLVFSTTRQNLTRPSPDDVKILMTNDVRLSVRDVVELYSLRWQIELFFKELKSSLGFHQYQFRKFDRVVAWAELALATFLYLECYRVQQLSRRNLSDDRKRWWQHQRTHGLIQAVRLISQQSELHYLAERLQTPGGITKLKRLLQSSLAPEYAQSI